MKHIKVYKNITDNRYVILKNVMKYSKYAL